MRRLIALVPSFAVLAFASYTASAHASEYKGFYYGAKDQHALAAVARQAYVNDPSGLKPMDPAKCAKDGSCGSLQNYVEAFKGYAGVSLTVAQVPDFIDSLTMDCTITGDYYMARVDMKGKGPGKTQLDKMHRPLKKGECALVWNGRVVLVLFCANPNGELFRPPPPPKGPDCAEVDIVMDGDQGSTLHVFYGGTYRPTVCEAMQVPSDKTAHPLPADCDEDCYVDAANEYGPVRHLFKHRVREDGIHRFFVPIECTQDNAVCTFSVCLDNREHSTTEHIVYAKDYDPKTKIAVIGQKDWDILY